MLIFFKLGRSTHEYKFGGHWWRLAQEVYLLINHVIIIVSGRLLELFLVLFEL